MNPTHLYTHVKHEATPKGVNLQINLFIYTLLKLVPRIHPILLSKIKDFHKN